MIPIDNFLILSAILFSLGMYGVLARRNAVMILMSVELMLQAVVINFVAFAVYLDPDVLADPVIAPAGLIIALFVIVIAAAEVGLALAIILRIFRNRQISNVDEADLMRW